MEGYAELMKDLCEPLARVQTSLLGDISSALIEHRHTCVSPAASYVTTRDRLAMAMDLPRADQFIANAILMVVATELENRRRPNAVKKGGR